MVFAVISVRRLRCALGRTRIGVRRVRVFALREGWGRCRIVGRGIVVVRVNRLITTGNGRTTLRSRCWYIGRRCVMRWWRRRCRRWRLLGIGIRRVRWRILVVVIRWNVPIQAVFSLRVINAPSPRITQNL